MHRFVEIIFDIILNLSIATVIFILLILLRGDFTWLGH